MRLKLIFLPLTLIVAFSLLVGFVYPEFKEAMGIYNGNKKLSERLSEVNKKSDNIQKLDQELGSNKIEEDYILKYVPNKRAEERAIDGINSIAEENILVVSDISIKNDPNAKISEEKKKSSANLLTPVGALEASPVAVEDPNTLVEGGFSQANKTSITVSVIGKYPDIKSFIAKVSSIDMANDIISVKISNTEDDGEKKDAVVAVIDDAQTAQSQEKILSAEIAIDFYYSGMFESKDYLNEKVFELPNFDFAPVKTVRDYVKNEIKKLEVIGQNKANPFL